MSRSVRGSLLLELVPWLAAFLVALALPVPCIAFIAGVYLAALGLHVAGLWNGFLWAWLVEASFLVWYFLRPGEPNDLVLLFLVWSTPVLFWVGFTLVLERLIGPGVASKISLFLVVVQFVLFVPFSLWIRELCKLPVHACSCGCW